MSHPYAQALTASDLLEGDVVYLNAQQEWSRDFSQAKLFFDTEAAEQALSRATARQDKVVGPYLIDISAGNGTPKPTLYREVFRTIGPSNRFHGKQANQVQHV